MQIPYGFIILHIKTRNDCKALFRLKDISAIYDGNIELSNGSMFEVLETIEDISKIIKSRIKTRENNSCAKNART